jgi:SAM-dependent methyltransferase
MTAIQFDAIKERQQRMWASGDFSAVAARIHAMAEGLAEAADVQADQRVLDVATGSGNAAIAAARCGADVVGIDYVPELLERARVRAAAEGLPAEFIAADAEALPFEDASFDTVLSVVGVMFAPDQERAASELLRVCRPGGTIGMLNFTPEGLARDFFGTLGPYMPPPPPGALPPLLWGNEDHVRNLLGDRAASLEMTRDTYAERAASPRDYVELFTQTFGPAVAIHDALANEPLRAAAFDRDFLEFATRANTGDPNGPAEYRYEYLLVIARKRTT